MISSAKNRVLVFLNDTDVYVLKVMFATSEQARVFSDYMQMCLDSSDVFLRREVLKDGVWTTIDTQELHATVHRSKRATHSPFKLEIRSMANVMHEEYCLRCYLFSGMDVDYINMLLLNGTSDREVVISGYCRCRETGEWLERDMQLLAPSALARTFSKLSDKSKVDVICYANKLKLIDGACF